LAKHWGEGQEPESILRIHPYKGRNLILPQKANRHIYRVYNQSLLTCSIALITIALITINMPTWLFPMFKVILLYFEKNANIKVL
jgi:hypothetical protein